MDGLETRRRTTGKLLLAGGFIIYLLVQGALMNLPLANWPLLPELDDSLTYALKTRQMEECWSQPCPALEDLRQQLPITGEDSAAAVHQLNLAFSRIFPVYHPLFSLILLGLSKLGLGLLSAYQWLWRLSPLIFGSAFACLLVALTEPAAAGIALALLAFKIFPDTGLHHLVPSNLAMAGAVLVWARIIFRRGWAPWTLALSSMLLPAIHPVGVLYTVVSIALALVLAQPPARRKLFLVTSFMALVIGAIFLISSLVKGVALVQFTLIPPVPDPIRHILRGALQNAMAIGIGIIRSAGSLFGAAPVFLAAVVLGLLTLPSEQRRINRAMVVIYVVFLFVMLFYVSSHPGDVVLRLWIPLVVVLSGLVGQAGCYAWRASRDFFKNRNLNQLNSGKLVAILPVIILAGLLGYALQMVAAGTEQVITYVDFLRKRQPLVFNPEQPRMLLARAQPGDRVFYNSLIIMPYFFIHGTMRLGAVYYNPALQGRPATEAALSNPGVHYAVTYNPTVYHPAFAGEDETNWWLTSPNFRFSPLDKPRRLGPLAREGAIASRDYQWLDLELGQSVYPKVLKIRIVNKGKQSTITISPLSVKGEVLAKSEITAVVPGYSAGWLLLPLDQMPSTQRFRLSFPAGEPDYLISGISFGDEPHRWPWAQKAVLTAKPREYGAPDITVAFDPQKMLPPPLNQRKISILNDSGSSVLFRLD